MSYAARLVSTERRQRTHAVAARPTIVMCWRSCVSSPTEGRSETAAFGLRSLPGPPYSRPLPPLGGSVKEELPFAKSADRTSDSTYNCHIVHANRRRLVSNEERHVDEDYPCHPRCIGLA